MTSTEEEGGFLISGQEGVAWRGVSSLKWNAIVRVLPAIELSSYEAMVSETRDQV